MLEEKKVLKPSTILVGPVDNSFPISIDVGCPLFEFLMLIMFLMPFHVF